MVCGLYKDWIFQITSITLMTQDLNTHKYCCSLMPITESNFIYFIYSTYISCKLRYFDLYLPEQKNMDIQKCNEFEVPLLENTEI